MTQLLEPPQAMPVPPPAPQRPKRPFYESPWFKRSLPWAISGTFHLILFLVAVAVVPPLVKQAMSAPSQEQIIIPDTQLANATDIGGLPNPGLGKDPTRGPTQENNANPTDASGWSERKSESLTQTLKSAAISGTDVIAQGQGNIGQGKSTSALAAIEGDTGGELSNFGPRGGGMGLGPKSRMFGHGSNVRSIIYVCDGSGSIVGGGKDSELRSELKKDVASLSPIQAFNVIFFQEPENPQTTTPYVELGDSLMMAKPINKARLFDFIDNKLSFGRGTDPIPALEAAFAQHPELIFLLTDGDFDDNAAVVKTINRLNADKKVHVNTVLLLGSQRGDEVNQEFVDLMAKIAHDNGGHATVYQCGNG